jgi:hypothetical protein
MKIRAACFAALSAAMLATGGSAARPDLRPAGSAGSLTIRPGHVFRANSYVYRPLPRHARLDPRSRMFVASLLRQIRQYYGHAGVNTDSYTPSVFIVGRRQPTVRVRALRWSDPYWIFPPLQAQWNAVPVPGNFTPASGSDQEAVIYQPSTHRMWEFWRARRTGATVRNSAGQLVAEWGAQWGGRMDNIQRNPGYWVTSPRGYKFGTTASGIPLLAGLMTIQEQRRGVIDHIIGLAIPEPAARRWTFPAQRTDGLSTAADAIPEGTIFRLPASLKLDRLAMDPYARMIAKAVQRHGMIVWDRSGAVGFRAENPAGNYPASANPYYGPGGIFRCPPGSDPSHPPGVCLGFNRLAGFPWSKLEVILPPRS